MSLTDVSKQTKAAYLSEGIKEHLMKHKGKYIAGGTAAGLGGAYLADKYLNDGRISNNIYDYFNSSKYKDVLNKPDIEKDLGSPVRIYNPKIISA